MSSQDKRFLARLVEMPATAEQLNVTTFEGIVNQLHPSLIASFVPLPPSGIDLTLEQLNAVFGGDVRALREIAQLAYQICETDPKL